MTGTTFSGGLRRRRWRAVPGPSCTFEGIVRPKGPVAKARLRRLLPGRGTLPPRHRLPLLPRRPRLSALANGLAVRPRADKGADYADY